MAVAHRFDCTLFVGKFLLIRAKEMLITGKKMSETFDIDSKTKQKILVQVQGLPNRGDVRELRLSPKRWEAQSEWRGVFNTNSIMGKGKKM